MDNHHRYQEIVVNYIDSYNHFDIDGMCKELHNDVRFENIHNGQPDLITQGIEAFKTQAERAKKLFQKREQKIMAMKPGDESVEVQINYTGILATDLPNGLRAGDTINLTGKSTFMFKDGRIIEIKDES